MESIEKMWLLVLVHIFYMFVKQTAAVRVMTTVPSTVHPECQKAFCKDFQLHSSCIASLHSVCVSPGVKQTAP